MDRMKRKVGVYLTITVLVSVAFLVYILYARGTFESRVRVKLSAPNAEGIQTGMPVAFSGIAIGKVASVNLTDTGFARIELTFRSRDAKWLRENSRFILDKPIFGSARVKVITPDFFRPPLKDGAEGVLITGGGGDPAQLAAKADQILANVARLTAPEGDISRTIAHMQTLTGRMAGEHGVLGGVLGSDERAELVVDTIRKSRELVASLNQTTGRVDGMILKTDRWLFEQGGVADRTRSTVTEVNAILADVRGKLTRVDAILANVQGTMANLEKTSANVKTATDDLAPLRAEVDEAVGRVNAMISELNRKWPFATKTTEIKLP